MPKKKVVLKIELTEEEYRDLEALARREGYELPSHYATSLIKAAIKGLASVQPGTQATIDIDLLARRLRRVIEDLLNPYTAKIDEIARRIGELIDLVESITERQAEEKRTPTEAVQPIGEAATGRGRPSRRSAMDRLREDGILIASEARWIKDKDRFFHYLERQGAKVIRLHRDIVAVHPDFWREFVRVLNETSVRSIEDAARLVEAALGEAGGRLFRLLVKEGLAYYDEDRASWIVVET